MRAVLWPLFPLNVTVALSLFTAHPFPSQGPDLHWSSSSPPPWACTQAFPHQNLFCVPSHLDSSLSGDLNEHRWSVNHQNWKCRILNPISGLLSHTRRWGWQGHLGVSCPHEPGATGLEEGQFLTAAAVKTQRKSTTCGK